MIDSWLFTLPLPTTTVLRIWSLILTELGGCLILYVTVRRAET